MCPRKEGSNKSGEVKAIQAVVSENGHQKIPNTSNSSIKAKKRPNSVTPNGDCLHTFFNCRTAQQDSISDSQLIQLGKEYVKWALEHDGLPLKKTFWLNHGISRENLKRFREVSPDLNELVLAGNEYCGETREQRIKSYFQGIYNRQNVYVSDYLEHDEHMIEVRERIKHQIDKEEGLTPQQQQALFYSFMEPYLNKKSDAGK